MNQKCHKNANVTLIFVIFRIGVVTGYRGWMLNLYSVYSASNVRHLCALLCPAISFLHFQVLQFHVLQFHALQIGPSISRPSFSRPAFSAPPSSLVLVWSIFFCDSGSAHVGHCSGHEIMVQVLLWRLSIRIHSEPKSKPDYYYCNNFLYRQLTFTSR